MDFGRRERNIGNAQRRGIKLAGAKRKVKTPVDNFDTYICQGVMKERIKDKWSDCLPLELLLSQATFSEFMEQLATLATSQTLMTLRGSLMNIVQADVWGSRILSEESTLTESEIHSIILNGKLKDRCLDEIARAQNFVNDSLPLHPFFFLEQLLHFGGGSRLVLST